MKRRIALILCVLMALTLLSGCGGSAGSGGTAELVENTVLSAKLDADGVAHIPLMDGTVIKIDDDVKSASITANRATVVVLQNDGTIYFADKDLSNKHTLSVDAESFNNVCDNGFILTDKDGARYRVQFSDGSEFKIGKFGMIKAAKTMTLIYADDQGNVYLLPENAEEAEKIGKYDSYCTLNAVTNDGSICVWTSRDSSGHRDIYLHENDDTTKIGEYESTSDYASTYVTFSRDEQFAMIYSYYSDKMWIKKANEEEVAVKLGSDYSSGACPAGPISKLDSGKITELYVSTEASTGKNLYYVTLDGEREKVLSKVSSWVIRGKNIFYCNTDQELYVGKLEGASIAEETRIASSVSDIRSSYDGQYIYYLKDVDDELGNLYVFKVGEKEPKKIATDVGCVGTSGLYYVCRDGKSVIYFKDLEDLSASYEDYGTLYTWSYSSGESTKICNDVMEFSLLNGVNSYGYDTSALMFNRYDEVDKDKNVLVTWMFYNGKEAVKVVSDIID